MQFQRQVKSMRKVISSWWLLINAAWISMRLHRCVNENLGQAPSQTRMQGRMLGDTLFVICLHHHQLLGSPTCLSVCHQSNAFTMTVTFNFVFLSLYTIVRVSFTSNYVSHFFLSHHIYVALLHVVLALQPCLTSLAFHTCMHLYSTLMRYTSGRRACWPDSVKAPTTLITAVDAPRLLVPACVGMSAAHWRLLFTNTFFLSYAFIMRGKIQD